MAVDILGLARMATFVYRTTNISLVAARERYRVLESGIHRRYFIALLLKSTRHWLTTYFQLVLEVYTMSVTCFGGYLQSIETSCRAQENAYGDS
jgi:hypothetical protein